MADSLYPARYRTVESTLIVTKPTGEVVQRPTTIIWDSITDTVEVKMRGESPLKDYIFGIVRGEINRCMTEGTFVHEVL